MAEESSLRLPEQNETLSYRQIDGGRELYIRHAGSVGTDQYQYAVLNKEKPLDYDGIKWSASREGKAILQKLEAEDWKVVGSVKEMSFEVGGTALEATPETVSERP
jgi:hypothetical protein